MLHWLDRLESAGVRLFNIFTLYRIMDVSQWGVYEGFNMQPGTGLAALDGANVNDFENLPAIKSETAGAIKQWRAWQVPTAPSVTMNRAELGAIGRTTWANSAPAA